MKKVPITILTGYLGSGKTTLLNYILTQEHGQRIAVIENEFGDINVDQEIVIQTDEEIFEVSNGCICCSVRGDLVRILEGLRKRKRPFDRIIIETTGVADPAPVIQTFLADPQIKENYELDGVITLVDAKHFSIQVERSSEVKRQIYYTDKVVISKADLVTENELESVYQKVQSLNSQVEIEFSEFGKVDLEKILEIKMHQEKGIMRTIRPVTPSLGGLTIQSTSNQGFSLNPNKGIHEDEVESVSLQVEGKEVDPTVFEFWLNFYTRQKGDEIYRIKGILAVRNQNEKYIFQGVHNMIDYSLGEKWPENQVRVSRLVAIGKNLDRSGIESGFLRCFK